MSIAFQGVKSESQFAQIRDDVFVAKLRRFLAPSFFKVRVVVIRFGIDQLGDVFGIA